MNITMIGTGYVGLVTGALFANKGNNVICVDKNPEIVETLKSGKIHIFEPGLEEIVKESEKKGNLSFTPNIEEGVNASDIIFLAVGTPSDDDGAFNLKYLKDAARDVGRVLKNQKGYKIVVGKSTVPQGTCDELIKIINEEVAGNKNLEWDYVANPETLAEGSAVKDFSSPDRILIGTYSDKAFNIMKELYHPFNIRNNRIIRGSPVDAELAKLLSNTILAGRIAMINEMARIADVTKGADMEIIRDMMCSDSRIGYKFMFPGPGYGGSCFPKDVQGLVQQSTLDGYFPLILSQIHPSNESHKLYVAYRISELLKKDNPTIAVWGLTFKPNTDDMRNSASIPIITDLINRGANVQVYDPQDKKAREIFKDAIKYGTEKYEVAEGADALVLLTEWNIFDSPNFKYLKEIMKGNYIFDMRNRWIPEAANRNGFNYFGIGRNFPLKSHNRRKNSEIS